MISFILAPGLFDKPVMIFDQRRDRKKVERLSIDSTAPKKTKLDYSKVSIRPFCEKCTIRAANCPGTYNNRTSSRTEHKAMASMWFDFFASCITLDFKLEILN